MRNVNNNPILFIIAVILVALAAGATPSEAQTPGQAYRAPRLPGTQAPDLNGIWQVLDNSINWDLEGHTAGPAPFPELTGAYGAMPAGVGVVEGGQIPYQSWALAKKKENFEKRLVRPTTLELNQTAGDPEAKCYLPGVPRATYIGLPFQIIQTPNQILVSYEFDASLRMIHVDRKPEAPLPSWMGWSVAQWEGDTFVVQVTDQREETWFDRAGNFHSDALKVTERYTPITPYHMMYEATIEDPKVFTRPWKISMPLYRAMEPNKQILDYRCVEFVETFMYGHLLDGPK